ncbi:MAG: ferric reductase-like transmembrane domain-containing protein [Symbiobacteriaceae bacterium]
MTWSFLRAAGITAYLLLWASTCLGLAGRARLAAGLGRGLERWWMEAHRWLGLLGMAFTAAHLGGLLVDRHTPFTWSAILVPGAAPVRAAGSALGTLSLYGFAVALVAVGLRRRLGAGAWQVLHACSVVAFGLALCHGVVTGTDAGLPWVRGMYVGTGIVFLVFSLYRGVQAWRESWAAGGRVRPSRLPAGIPQASEEG